MASFFRLLGLVLIALALMLLGADIMSTIETAEMRLRTTDYILGLANGSPRVWVDANQDQWWVGVVNGMLLMPAWVLPGILGFLLTLATKPKKRGGGGGGGPPRPPAH